MLKNTDINIVLRILILEKLFHFMKILVGFSKKYDFPKILVAFSLTESKM